MQLMKQGSTRISKRMSCIEHRTDNLKNAVVQVAVNFDKQTGNFLQASSATEGSLGMSGTVDAAGRTADSVKSA